MAKRQDFRRAVRTWLASHDKTQGWLAEQVGIHESNLSRAMNGRSTLSPEPAKRVKQITGIVAPTSVPTQEG